MYAIAFKMLIRSKAKFYAMVFGIAACSMMMAQQPAIFMGIMVRTYGLISDIPQVDIWVVKAGVKDIETAPPLRYNDLFIIKSLPNVKWAVPFYKGIQRVKLQNGEFVLASVIGVDDVSLIGLPGEMVTGNMEDLKNPSAIFLDNNVSLQTLYKINSDNDKLSLEIGEHIELNEQRKIIAGYINSTPSVLSHPTIYTTYSSAVRSAQIERNSLTAVLVKVREGVDPQYVVENINKLPNLHAYTKQQFANSIFANFVEKSSIMESFGIGIGFVFMVSIIIISSIFYSFVGDNIRSLAVLKAMGLNDKMISKMTLLQLSINGVAGFCLGMGAASLFGLFVNNGKVGYKLLPQMVLFSGMVILIICIISAYIALNKIKKSEPAIVFKNS